MRSLLVKLLVWTASGIAARCIFAGCMNLRDGKDFLGREKTQKEKTYVDWKGNIILGKQDYVIEG